ncbi:UDP-glucose/GDP-mannose dehydrogenase family protein [Halobacillus sp. Marseille-Q1614]|uniref:UDP-glucose dehydrogenase family protein n=1 Tax=Halobacillus sp. Marseille-Q1614 TaxID=2709134 RepID=UPI00156FD0AA|nr:UDP-glucose/GDP-mannose dehydrogenase family protein [Halobacillus sp. Marseille-Q1614]
MKILFIGMGYVGTTMSTALAMAGHLVTGFDVDEEKISSLKEGKLYFHEPELQEMMVERIRNKQLFFTTDPQKAIEGHDIIFITVGTPSLSSGKADLRYIKKAAEMIGRYKASEKIVVIKSTVPIGTTRNLEQWVQSSSVDSSLLHTAMNPEFLREGNALHDALNPDRIVIGSESSKALHTLTKLYQAFHCPIVTTSSQAAEMIKYASNAFLATKISFINEIARLCDQKKIEIQDVSKGMGLDHRIGPAFLQAGLGYGGSCFPKDTKELLWTAENSGCPLHILQEAEKVNQSQPQYFIDKIKQKVGPLEKKKAAVFGLSFKPHTDDTRESVSFSTIEKLLLEKAQVQVHDPVVKLTKNWLDQGVEQFPSAYAAAKDCDFIVICTDWPEYGELDWGKIHSLMKDGSIFDGRNMLDAVYLKSLGFHYQGIGYE